MIRLFTGTLTVSLMLTGAVRAEEESIEQRLAELEREIRELKRTRQTERSAPVVTADSAGFSIASADGAFQLKLRGYAQADSRWFLDDEAKTGNDGFLLRRVRPILEGRLWKEFDFYIMPEYGGGSVSLVDAYLGWNHWQEFRWRAGQFRSPVGLERLQSSSALTLNERAFPSELLPDRDIGLMAHGALWDGVIEYAAGGFNGAPDGGTSSSSNPTDELEAAGRLLTHPFKQTDLGGLQGLGVGVAGTVGDEKGTPTSPQVSGYRTPGQARFFRYRSGTPATAADTVVANGERWRFSPQGYYYWGAFGLLGEYALSHQEVSLAGTTAELEHTAWQVTVSWVLTGEPASYRGVKPRKPFSLKNGDWGAVELVGRYQELDVDNAAFPTFANPASSATKATGWSVGMNWYLNASLKAQTSYSHTQFDGGNRSDEHVVFTRLQVAF
jgi:phosphate-selective porin OprO/OprP